jgi:hypothetical protein
VCSYSNKCPIIYALVDFFGDALAAFFGFAAFLAAGAFFGDDLVFFGDFGFFVLGDLTFFGFGAAFVFFGDALAGAAAAGAAAAADGAAAAAAGAFLGEAAALCFLAGLAVFFTFGLTALRAFFGLLLFAFFAPSPSRNDPLAPVPFTCLSWPLVTPRLSADRRCAFTFNV